MSTSPTDPSPCPKCKGAVKYLGLSLDHRYSSEVAIRHGLGESRFLCRQCNFRFGRPTKLSPEQAMRFVIREESVDECPRPFRRKY